MNLRGKKKQAKRKSRSVEKPSDQKSPDGTRTDDLEGRPSRRAPKSVSLVTVELSCFQRLLKHSGRSTGRDEEALCVSYPINRSNSAIWVRMTSRLERQNSILWMSMPKRAARVFASAMPVEERKASQSARKASCSLR